MTIKYLYLHFPIKGPPKFTQIGIFGLKGIHLATLVEIKDAPKKNEPPFLFFFGEFIWLRLV
jgi:hypothetical protein